MGVIKNLMVRIGADVRGYTGGMKNAANTTSSTSQTVNKHMSNMKKTVTNSFTNIGTAIKEHSAAVSRTKEDYAVTIQNADRLSDRVQQLRGVYDTVKSATQGLDMAKPLTEQMVDAEKALVQIESRRKKVEAELQSLSGSARGSGTKRFAALQAELNTLAEKSRFAVARLENLDRVADAVGSSNIGYASAAGLQQLEGQIRSTENELNTAKIRTEELSAKLKSLGIWPTVGRAIKNIGTAAAQAAGNGVTKLWQKLKNLGNSAVHGIASLPAKLRNIGHSASASCGGLGKMVRSIRNIGIASLGMRVAAGMFGRLRSIISNYIYQNEELNASVTSLRNQLGEALLPAINLVLGAMQRLMPLITAVSRGINSILTSLFGNMANTTAAIKNAVDEANNLQLHGFDKITKASDASESDGTTSTNSGGGQSKIVQQLTSWIQQLKAAFVAGDWKGLGQIVGDGINSAFDAIDAIDVGSWIGRFADNIVTTAHSTLETVDFSGIGQKLGGMFTSALESVDWNQAGDTIGLALTALPGVIAGFIIGTKWDVVGVSLSDMLKSVFTSGTRWVKETDWLQLGQSAYDLIANIDWKGIATEVFRYLGSALGACVLTLWGFIDDIAKSIGNYMSQKLSAAGGNVAKAIGSAVIDAVEAMINGIIGGINTLLEGLNSFLSLGEKVGIDLSVPTISEVKLPRPKAARGTIVSQATDLTVGEDGTEAIVPLERHTEWLDVLASKLTAKISGGGRTGTPMTIQIIMGGRKVTEYFIQDINQITHENGVCPINT